MRDRARGVMVIGAVMGALLCASCKTEPLRSPGRSIGLGDLGESSDLSISFDGALTTSNDDLARVSDGAMTPNDLLGPADLALSTSDAAVQGLAWRSSSNGTTRGLQGVWATSPTDVWAVGYKFLHGTGDPIAWSIEDPAPVPLAYSIWAASPSDLWVSASDSSPGISAAMVQGSGDPLDTWTHAAGATAFGLYGVSGSSSLDVWAVGDGATVLHGVASPLGWYTFASDYDGTAPKLPGTWQGCRQLYGVWSAAYEDVWMVGSSETVFHVSGAALTIETSLQRGHLDGECGAASNIDTLFNNDLRGIWGSSTTDLWAVGHDGLIMHGVGSPPAWTQVASDTSHHLMAVWGTSVTDVWAVGVGGTIVHGTGSPLTWEAMDSGTTNDLRAIHGTSAYDIWAVGDKGTIVHYSY